MNTLRRGLDAVTDLTAILAGICIVAMMAHIAVDVVIRAVMNRPLTGTITFVANYYMVFLVCLPLAFVERLDAHISVEVLTERMPPRLRRHLYGWTYPVTALVFGVTAYATWLEAVSKFAIRTFIIEKDMAISTWFGYFALPVGYALLSLYLLLKFLLYLTGQTFVPHRPSGADDTAEVIHD